VKKFQKKWQKDMKKIVKIKSLGVQKVYDISVNHDSHNFLLDNGVVAHNCHVQPALRGFLDEFSSNATFILTCNFPQRIIDPLISRLTVINFKFDKADKMPAAKHMLKRACHILDTEGVEYDKNAVGGLVTKNFPDFRKTLVQLQRFSAGGKIDSDILVGSSADDMTELFEFIKEKNFNKCRQWVANVAPDPSTFYRGIYDKLLPLLVPQTIPPLILSIAEYQDRATGAIDQEINQVAFLIQAMTTVQFK
jgi:DNA polymerase III gamma/tau subunit